MAIVAANWKMTLTASEGAELIRAVASEIQSRRNEFWVAPSFTAIPMLAPLAKQFGFKLGGQNVHWEGKGAFTGEISAPMLKEYGCSFVIVGHSERRHIFNESDEIIAKRFRAAIESGLTPILCVGETLAEREAGETEKVLARQLKLLDTEQREASPFAKAMGDSNPARKYVLPFLVAYEPVWAIGTGKVASATEIKAAHEFIAKKTTAKILYGGSVTPENFSEILKVPNVAGGLIGGASTKVDSLKKLLS